VACTGTPKRLLTEVGPVDLDVPRDRAGSFDPRIVPKGQSRLGGFNDRIIVLYARGTTTRDIRAHLRELYDVEVSPDLISPVTDAAVEELAEWQSRWLDSAYPVVFGSRQCVYLVRTKIGDCHYCQVITGWEPRAQPHIGDIFF
jgi:transposase-like protein